MIKAVRVVNQNNDTILMKLNGLEQGPFSLWSIEGLDQGEADVHVTELATMDGAVYNSARQNSRELTLTMLLNWPNDTNRGIQWAREQVYKYFPLKKKISIIFYLDDYDNGGVKAFGTEGYVKENPVDIFAKQCAARATIIRIDPFFRPWDDSLISVSHPYGDYKSHTYNFSDTVYYSSTGPIAYSGTDTGAIFEIPIGYDYSLATIGKSISISNIGQYLTPDDAHGWTSGQITIWLERIFKYVDFQSRGLKAGDKLRIYNLSGCKDVRIYLYDEIKEISVLGVTDLTKIMSNPWPNFMMGLNNFIATYTYGTPATTGPLGTITGANPATVQYKEAYRGI